MSHGTVCYLYSLHPDFYTLVNIINIRDLMDNFFNSGPKILKLIVRFHIYHIFIYIQKKNCSYENRIFKNFFLDIYRSQTDYNPKGAIIHLYHEENKLHFNEMMMISTLYPHVSLDFYGAGSLKQQSAGRHVTSLEHIILTLSQPVFVLIS